MKKILIGVGALLILVITFFALTGDFKFSARLDSEDEQVNKSAVSEEWVEYTSKQFGYTISIPEDWTLNETIEKNSPDFFAVNKNGDVWVRIQALYDPTIKTESDVLDSIDAYKQSFNEKPKEKLEEFKSDVQDGIGGFFAAGQMDFSDDWYAFYERGLIATNGRVLIMRGAFDPSAGDFTTTINQIMDTFSLEK